MKTALIPMAGAIALLAACGDHEVNPPNEPAAPLRTPEAMQPVEPPGPSSLAGRGPRSFVGVWAANPQWCARPQGERSPIRREKTAESRRQTGVQSRAQVARQKACC